MVIYCICAFFLYCYLTIELFLMVVIKSLEKYLDDQNWMIGPDFSSNNGGISSTLPNRPILSSIWKYMSSDWMEDDNSLAVQGIENLRIQAFNFS